MEQDDAKIAEKWWSGTSEPSGAAAEPPAAESADWEALRQKFATSHEAQPASKGAHSSRALRTFVLLVAILFALLVGGSLLVLSGGSHLPAQVRDTMGALFEEAPAQAVSAVEPSQEKARRPKAKINGRKVSNARESEVIVPSVVKEEPPFTIEVIDRNRRTVVHAYEDPLHIAVEDPSLVSTVAPDVPSLVIEEKIRPDGSFRTTTNVGASVVLTGIIGTDGKMRDLSVVRGPVEFVPAAMEAVRRWRFGVAQQEGLPTERPARVTVNMAIKSDGQPSGSLK